MINTKLTTQAWSEAKQVSSLKGNDTNYAGAAEFKKAYGDQSVGDILNKAADPNWVDPAKMRKGVGNAELGKDAFMKLMLEQLKAQDPLNPLKSHEMSAQLAQFSSLEKLATINDSIDALKKSQDPTINFQALNFIGKTVESDSSQILRFAGDTDHDISFNLMGDAAKVMARFIDANGLEVGAIEFKDLQKGHNTVTWNGISENGQPVAEGQYRVELVAASSNGAKVGLETKVAGKITGVNFTAEGPVLLVGNRSVRMSDIRKIRDLGTEKVKPDLKKVTGATQNNSKAEGNTKTAPVKTGSNIQAVPMASGLKNTVDQAVAKKG
jgi:flagellar basal-body rod modification protein FlgD